MDKKYKLPVLTHGGHDGQLVNKVKSNSSARLYIISDMAHG